jgi:ethanolamine utilization protein EutP
MKEHKLMVVGAVGSGKSSLIAYLNGSGQVAKKTQAVLYDTLSIDTPGEYMENPSMYKYVLAAAQTVEYVLFIQDSTQRRCIYPPGFAQSFNRKSIGIITKVDCEEVDVEHSKRFLQTLGVKGPIFKTSSKTGYGIEELKEYLDII